MTITVPLRGIALIKLIGDKACINTKNTLNDGDKIQTFLVGNDRKLPFYQVDAVCMTLCINVLYSICLL